MQLTLTHKYLLAVIVLLLVIYIYLLLQKQRVISKFYDGMFLESMNYVYINIESRKDRKALLLAELSKLDVREDQIHRIDAVKMPGNGHKGCVQSHIKALEFIKSQGWSYAIILEDDFELSVDPIIYKKQVSDMLVYLSDKSWDVVMLATAYATKTPLSTESIVRIKRATTSSAYIVNSSYIDKLLDCFRFCDSKMSENKMSDNESRTEEFALDQQWAKLQEIDNWFGFSKDISKQRAIWSSIQTP